MGPVIFFHIAIADINQPCLYKKMNVREVRSIKNRLFFVEILVRLIALKKAH